MADARSGQEENRSGEAEQLLAMALKAKDEGNAKLAFHLFLSAAELFGKGSKGANKALHSAWDIAVALGDRRLAETAFEKIAPSLGPAQSVEYAKKLASLAMNDLSALGIDPSEFADQANIEEMIGSLPPQLAEMIDVDEVQELLGAITGHGGFNVTLDDEGPIDNATGGSAGGANGANGAGGANGGDGSSITPTQHNMTAGVPDGPAGLAAPGVPLDPNDMAATARDFLANTFGISFGPNIQMGHEQEAKPSPAPRFADVPGFDDIKQQLRSFGIGINPDSPLGKQAEEDLLYHGIDGKMELPSVIIRVPDGTDCTRLVHAVAGEMGVAFGQISVRETSSSSRRRGREVAIRVRGDFSPMRHGAVPTKGVLLIDNADYWPSGLATSSWRVSDFISSLAAQPGVAVILTTSEDRMPPADLVNRLGSEVRIINVLPPRVSERYYAWQQVVQAHPSARGIDVALLAMVTEGMLPDTFEHAVQDAATDAWRIGVNEGRRHDVTTLDVLGNLAEYAADADVHDRIISVIETQWSQQIDNMTAEDLAFLNGETSEAPGIGD